MMFLLKCPRCGNRMKYDYKGNSIIGKRKTCVYCNFSMDARKVSDSEAVGLGRKFICA